MIDPRAPLTVGTYGFNVPCRRFLITANVTRERRLPVVDEFYLRALKLCERIPIRRLGNYFGFSEMETEIVTADLVSSSLAEVHGDTVALHPSAYDHFSVGADDIPRITEIETWIEHVWFDLVSRNIMAADRTRTSKNLADIKADDSARDMPVAFARAAFEANFVEYLRNVRRIPDPDGLGLYSISSVEPGRFGFVVIKGRDDLVLDPHPRIEPHLLEVDVGSVARFRPLSDALWDAYRRFTAPTPSGAALADYMRLTNDQSLQQHQHSNGMFDIVSWITQQGGERDPDRSFVVGANYLERNIDIFTKLLESRILPKLSQDTKDVDLFWLRSTGTAWGASPDLDASISGIKSSFRRVSRTCRLRTTLVVPQASRAENNKRFERLFDSALLAPTGYLSPALEVILLKGIGAVVTVSVRLSATASASVGIATVNSTTLARIDELLRLDSAEEFKQLWRHAVADEEDGTVSETPA